MGKVKRTFYISFRDHPSSENIHEETKIRDVTKEINEKKLKCGGYVRRSEEGAPEE